MLAGFDGELCRCDSVRAVVANVPDELYQPGILVDARARIEGFCQNSCQTRRREVKAEFSLRRFENSKHTAGTPEVKQATAAGGDVLVVAGAGAEEVAELVVASTEPLRGCKALDPAHTSRAPFHAPVVLLQSIVMGWPAPHPCRSKLAGRIVGQERI